MCLGVVEYIGIVVIVLVFGGSWVDEASIARRTADKVEKRINNNE